MNPRNWSQFYLQPARKGEKLRFGHMGSEGGPPDWPYIDVRHSDLIVEFKYDGINEKLSPFEALRKVFFGAIKEHLFAGRTFKLVVPELTSLERLQLKVAVEGKPIPGWVDHSQMWTDPSQFFDTASLEYAAYCLTLRSEKTREQIAAMRRRSPDLDATWTAAHDAQAKLRAA